MNKRVYLQPLLNEKAQHQRNGVLRFKIFEKKYLKQFAVTKSIVYLPPV